VKPRTPDAPGIDPQGDPLNDSCGIPRFSAVERRINACRRSIGRDFRYVGRDFYDVGRDLRSVGKDFYDVGRDRRSVGRGRRDARWAGRCDIQAVLRRAGALKLRA